LSDPATGELIEGAGEGEVCLRIDPRPVGLMTEYYKDPEKNETAFFGGYYRTGDIMERDENGIYTYVGRADDVFKASDYKLSPYAKIRRLEFAELPKTVSGKIRRVELRKKEADFHGADGERTEQSLAARTTNGGYDHEYSATDFK